VLLHDTHSSGEQTHCASVGYTILNTKDSRNGSKRLTKICDLGCTRKKNHWMRWQSIHEEDLGLPALCRPWTSKGFCPSTGRPFDYISFSREDCDLGRSLPPYQILVRQQANPMHRSNQIPSTYFWLQERRWE